MSECETEEQSSLVTNRGRKDREWVCVDVCDLFVYLGRREVGMGTNMKRQTERMGKRYIERKKKRKPKKVNERERGRKRDKEDR